MSDKHIIFVSLLKKMHFQDCWYSEYDKPVELGGKLAVLQITRSEYLGSCIIHC